MLLLLSLAMSLKSTTRLVLFFADAFFLAGFLLRPLSLLLLPLLLLLLVVLHVLPPLLLLPLPPPLLPSLSLSLGPLRGSWSSSFLSRSFRMACASRSSALVAGRAAFFYARRATFFFLREDAFARISRCSPTSPFSLRRFSCTRFVSFALF